MHFLLTENKQCNILLPYFFKKIHLVFRVIFASFEEVVVILYFIFVLSQKKIHLPTMASSNTVAWDFLFLTSFLLILS